MVKRTRLPDRRPAESVKLAHEGQTVHATAGFDPTGAVREVFLRRGGPPGSDMDRLLDDVGVLISNLLQLGVTPADLAHGVGRLGAYPEVAPYPGQPPRDPVEALVEILTNPDYGFGFDKSEINRAALRVAEIYCDELVVSPAASIVGVVSDWLVHLAADHDPEDPDDLDDIKIGGTD